MNTYKAIFSYDGSSYYGWQKQPDQLTVQGSIEKVLQTLSKAGSAQVIGCGRTDAGVHAVNQVTKISLEQNMEPCNLKRALNSLLDKSIRCLAISRCSDDFQPVFDAKKKTYRYYFIMSEVMNPHYSLKMTHIKKKLDIDKMKRALPLFVGKKDFVNFSTKGTPVKSTEREVYSFDLYKMEASDFLEREENIYYFEISGNGFLKQMVRLIVSAIFSYGEGKIGADDINSFFLEQKTSKLAPTAHPDGLYLYDVTY